MPQKHCDLFSGLDIRVETVARREQSLQRKVYNGAYDYYY